MAKKIFLMFLVSSLLLNIKVKADEGMWLPLLIERLNYVDMQKWDAILQPMKYTV